MIPKYNIKGSGSKVGMNTSVCNTDVPSSEIRIGIVYACKQYLLVTSMK